jgi:hypothetical protein
MTDSPDNDTVARLDEALKHAQRQERADRDAALARQQHTDEKIVQSLSGDGASG